MNLSSVFRERDGFWDAVIVVTAAAAFLLNLIGLLSGITIVIPHLLYIPVVIAAYRYPQWGIIIAGLIGAVYFLMVLLLNGSTGTSVAETLVRTGVMIAIGWLVGTLTLRLHEQQDLYQGLFDHSEGGSILIQDSGTGRTIEEVNWKAADLLHRKTVDLRGRPLSTIWNGEEEQEFFARLSLEGAVYTTETSFLLPDEKSFTVLVSAAALPKKRPFSPLWISRAVSVRNRH